MTISLSASNANISFIVLCCLLLSMPSELPRCIHQVQTHAPALFPKSHPKRLVCLAAGSEVAENASHLTRTSRWFKRSLQCRSYQCKETYLSIYPQITINHDVEIIKKMVQLWWMPISVSKGFGPATRTAMSRWFLRLSTTYLHELSDRILFTLAYGFSWFI